MSGNILCFLFGYSAGYLSKIICEQKCSNNHNQRQRIHNVNVPTRFTQAPNVVQHQPQVAIPCPNNRLPMASIEANSIST